jgi:phospho-N-acetylmuramoyl-pentapeptide-transferase
MFYWLANFSDTISALNVFRYITFRAVGATVTAGLFLFLFGPAMISQLRLKQGKGQPIRPDGPQSHLVLKKGTPTMGGLMILSGLVVSAVLWANPSNPYVWVVLGVTLGFGSIGFYDDYLKVTKQSHTGFSMRTRLLIEFLIAGAACYAIVKLGRSPMSTSLAFPFFKDVLLDFGWFFVAFGAFIVVGAGNAVNLTDGLDGLAIGPVMNAAGSFGIISWAIGNAVFAEYLEVNFVSGAGELAGLLGTVAVITKHEIVLGIIGGLFVLEAVSVIVQVVSFKLTGKRVFKMAPIHHHFEQLGWTEPQIVIRFWIISVVLALAGLSTLKLR